MRAFVFIADGARYAVDAACVEAVHPLVRPRPVPGAPPWLAGVIDVPVCRSTESIARFEMIWRYCVGLVARR